MPGPSEREASSWGAPAGLNVLERINPTALPWAASGLPLRGGNTPIIIENWYERFATIQMFHVRLPTPDRRKRVMSRFTQPQREL